MTQRHRFVLTLLAAILGLCTLGAPLPADAAIARPTNLRPLQSKADCAAALSLAAVVCDAAVKAGDLQLIWDESDKTVAGYKVYQVDKIGGHKLLGTSTGTARYYLVKKPPEGYANLCFAVQASVGSQTSADSPRYCYAPGATATTRSLKPSHTATQVTWKAPSGVTCGGPPLPGSAFFQGADKVYGSAFTAFFPWLKNEQPPSGQVGVSGVYAGDETAILRAKVNYSSAPWDPGAPFCSGVSPITGSDVTAQINALAGVAFDLGELARHKLYSANLTLTSSQVVHFLPSRKVALSNGGWCPTFVGTATREWRIAPLGNLTYSKSGLVTVVTRPTAPLDVTSTVSTWASYKYKTAYGFIVGNPLPPGPNPPASGACVTKFSPPALHVVYF